MFTNQQIFPPSMPYQQTRTLLVKTNGGSVVVEALLDEATDEWVTTDTVSTDGASPVVCGNATLRIIPSGGAKYRFL